MASDAQHSLAGMSDLVEELAAHLQGMAAPFLFVGAGLSRRYLGLDGWEGLLRRFASLTDKPYDRYASDAGGDFPAIASGVARGFNPVWWDRPQYAESRTRNEGNVRNPESPLKIEVAALMGEALAGLDEQGPYADELALLPKGGVDGLITTNYDPLLEHLFPGFKAYIGQEEMLFSEVQSVGEIYKIHGSWERPDSLVLTADDYAQFDEHNPYLAAKLMTIFVDRPIIFLGYSMGDRNITRILNAIARALSTEHLIKLQDRLVYVTWDPEAVDPHLGHGTFAVEGGVIPMRTVAVSDYTSVYTALAGFDRQLPARLLRQLKERVYELVLTSDPVGALKVVNINDAVDDMDVVFGVGVIDQLGAVGYFGVKRETLIDDVLHEDAGMNAEVLVRDVIPNLVKHARFTPIMKYLREAGLLTDAGKLRARKDVDPLIVSYVREGRKPFGTTQDSYKKADKKTASEVKTLGGLIAAESDPKKVLRTVHAFKDGAIDLALLHDYLNEHSDVMMAIASDRTLFAKAVCLYDWLKHAKV
jgi:SIR2-like domain